jgi:hypothetical protein
MGMNQSRCRIHKIIDFRVVAYKFYPSFPFPYEALPSRRTVLRSFTELEALVKP